MTRHYAAPVLARTGDLLKSGRFLKSLKLEAIDGILPAVLTYPLRDYDGDFVVPDGGDWSKYPSDPVVNWEHDVPVGRGTVKHCSIPIDGVRHELPVGNTRFFETANDLKGLSLNRYDAKGNVVGKYSVHECLDIAEQAYQHVSDEIVSGVSLEFDPIEKKTIGKSLRLHRPAYRFDSWRGLGWAHTANPVNKRAGLISLEERAEKALKALESGRVTHEVIRKSLTAVAAPLKDRTKIFTTGVTNVARTRKAMDDLTQDPPDVEVETDTEEVVDDAPETSPRPTEAALLNGAQALLDAASMLETASQSSEHAKGKKHIAKVIGMLQGEASKMQAMAEKIKAELDKNDDTEEVETDTEVEEPDGDDVELETDDEGALMSKSFAGFKPRRFVQKGRVTIAELKQTKGVGPDEVVVKKSRLKDLIELEKEVKKIL